MSGEDGRTRVLGTGAVAWARQLTATGTARPTLRADDIPLDVVHAVGSSVVGAVGEKRSTWRHWNLWAEASRQTMEWRFASARDREAVVGMVVEAAKRESLTLTPPELALSPEVFRREDGTSLFRPRHSVVFTSEALLAAEDRLLQRSADTSAPVVDLDVIERVTRKEARGHLLSSEQAETLARIVVSGRQVDLLIGPAGAGKTTAMRALHDAWRAQHGSGQRRRPRPERRRRPGARGGSRHRVREHRQVAARVRPTGGRRSGRGSSSSSTRRPSRGP